MPPHTHTPHLLQGLAGGRTEAAFQHKACWGGGSVCSPPLSFLSYSHNGDGEGEQLYYGIRSRCRNPRPGSPIAPRGTPARRLFCVPRRPCAVRAKGRPRVLATNYRDERRSASPGSSASRAGRSRHTHTNTHKPGKGWRASGARRSRRGRSPPPLPLAVRPLQPRPAPSRQRPSRTQRGRYCRPLPRSCWSSTTTRIWKCSARYRQARGACAGCSQRACQPRRFPRGALWGGARADSLPRTKVQRLSLSCLPSVHTNLGSPAASPRPAL